MKVEDDEVMMEVSMHLNSCGEVERWLACGW